MTNRVCVVGASGSLHNAKMGKLIDSHPIVIRVNCHVIEGHEDDVGEKVTIQAGSDHYIAKKWFHQDRRMAEYWSAPFKHANSHMCVAIHDFDNVHGDLIHPPLDTFNFPTLNGRSEEWKKEFHAHPNPGSGFRVIALALHMYPTAGIDIVGFGPSDRLETCCYESGDDAELRKEHQVNLWDPYYDAEGNTILDVQPRQHDLNEERRLLNLWESRGLLTRLEGPST